MNLLCLLGHKWFLIGEWHGAKRWKCKRCSKQW